MDLHLTISHHQPMIPQDLPVIPNSLLPQLRIDLIEEENGRNSGPSLKKLRVLVLWIFGVTLRQSYLRIRNPREICFFPSSGWEHGSRLGIFRCQARKSSGNLEDHLYIATMVAMVCKWQMEWSYLERNILTKQFNEGILLHKITLKYLKICWRLFFKGLPSANTKYMRLEGLEGPCSSVALSHQKISLSQQLSKIPIASHTSGRVKS